MDKDQKDQLNELAEDLALYERKPGDAVPTIWFKACTDRMEHNEFAKILGANTIIFGTLREILKKRFKARANKTPKMEEPNWDLRIAHREGYLQALKDVYRLIP